LFQKYGRFNFGNEFWILGLTIIIFIKLILCHVILIIIINFIICIERSMNIFIIYIGIIRPLFRFDHSNFKASLVIKIIYFNEIGKMAHLAMLVIIHVNMIICQNFNLPHTYCIFVGKAYFFEMKTFKLVTWYPNMI
jgi:hypothetical protein